MFSYISEGEPSEYGFLPAGVYEGKIVKMEEGISQGAKTRGCPQLAVHIRAFGPEGAATVRYYLTARLERPGLENRPVRQKRHRERLPTRPAGHHQPGGIPRQTLLRPAQRQTGRQAQGGRDLSRIQQLRRRAGAGRSPGHHGGSGQGSGRARRSVPASAPGGPAGQQPHERHGGTAGGRRRNPLLINSHEQLCTGS